LPSYTFPRITNIDLTHKIMLANYLKTTIRNLGNKKGYALINILGLTLGMACFAVIAYWVHDELSYDRMHSNYNRIYRVAGSVQTPSDRFEQAVTPPPLAGALNNRFTAVREAVRIDKNDAIVRSKTAQFKEDDILLTDPAFFRMFDFRLLQGDPKTALVNPYSIVMSRTMAEKYFPGENAIGKSLTLFLYDPEGTGAEYTVTGIIEDPPVQTHIRYNFLVSISTMESVFPEMASGGWFDNFLYTYLMLEDGTEPAALEQQLPLFLETQMGESMRQYRMFYRYRLQPLSEIYLHSDLRYELSAGGNFRYILIFSTIGIFILALAGINYINLSTAFAVDRMKDAGIRKVNGATSIQLFIYYHLESLLLVGCAFLTTVLILELFGGVLGPLIGREQIALVDSGVILILAGAGMLIGLGSGLFPAAYLSSVRPVKGLKRAPLWFQKRSAFRNSLVIIQFSVTVLLLAGIFVINDQLSYISERDYGFDKERLITLNVNGSDEVIGNFEPFKQELSGFAAVSGVARSNTSISDGLGNSLGAARDETGQEVRGTVFRVGIDHDFIPAYGLTLLAGRNFSIDIPSDSTEAFIVNESAVRTFGWESPSKALGQPFRFIGREGVIVGVVKNFHFSSLHQPIQPVCLYLLEDSFSKITVRAASADGVSESVSSLLSRVEELWHTYFPDTIFEYRFVDDQVAAQYDSERRMEKLFFIFSMLSLAIACIGLYGLAGFSSRRRTKEIGVRKVLGATARQLAAMLNAEFLRLVLIAFLIGSACAWYLMNRWLQQFAYRTELDPAVFLLAGGVAFLVALFAVSIQTLKAASVNPVDSIRTE